MAFSNVGSFCKQQNHCAQIKAHNGMQKRYAHRSSDSAFLKKARSVQSGANFQDKAVENWKRFPNMAERVWTTAGVMKSQGLFPFYHAQSSVMRPYRIFLETIQNRSLESYFRPFRIHRSYTFISHAEIVDKINCYIKVYGSEAWTPGVWNGMAVRMDADPFFRRHLVSLSYSVVHTQFQESAYHFLFQNKSSIDPHSAMEFLDEECEFPIKMSGMSDKKEIVIKQMRSFAHQYQTLSTGTLYIVGIPIDLAHRFVFDAKSFGIPTGNDMSVIVKDPTSSPRAFSDEEGGMQARLMLFDETMRASSNIQVVDATDPDECVRYVKGKAYINPRSLPEFEPFFKVKTSKIEDRDRTQRAMLDAEVRKFARSLKH